MDKEHRRILASLSDEQFGALQALADEVRLGFISECNASMSHGEMGARIGALEVLSSFTGMINAFMADE